MQVPKISLCIATYKRFDFLKDFLPKYLENHIIDEIVITDEDGHDYELIDTYFDNPKIKLYQNETHLGAFLNKERAVSLATNEWVALIDSDNYTPPEYFEAWLSYISINGPDSKCIYCPSKTLPEGNFDFSFLIDKVINKDTIKSLWNIHNFGCFMNTGNYIVNKKEYLHNPGNRKYENCKNLCIDVLYRNIYMMLNNCHMIAIPNMSYFHIRHFGFYLQNHETPGFQEMRKDIESMIV